MLSRMGWVLMWVPLTVLVAGCSQKRETADTTLPLAIDVRADTSKSQVLERTPPPQAQVWVSRVAQVRGSPLELDVPDAPLDSVLPDRSPPTLEIDDDLKPPILKHHAVLSVPASFRKRQVESVELDVRVDEAGDVSDALWVGGSKDSALVQSATECALGMKFYPAIQSGRPVPVWCRQRFDFGGSAKGR